MLCLKYAISSISDHWAREMLGAYLKLLYVFGMLYVTGRLSGVGTNSALRILA